MTIKRKRTIGEYTDAELKLESELCAQTILTEVQTYGICSEYHLNRMGIFCNEVVLRRRNA